jgi:hypothetical protein
MFGYLNILIFVGLCTAEMLITIGVAVIQKEKLHAMP